MVHKLILERKIDNLRTLLEHRQISSAQLREVDSYSNTALKLAIRAVKSDKDTALKDAIKLLIRHNASVEQSDIQTALINQHNMPNILGILCLSRFK